MKNYLIVISLFILSCEAQIEKSSRVQDVPFEGSIINIEAKDEIIDIKENSYVPSDSVVIHLNDFDIVLSEYLCYNVKNLKNINADTIYLDEEVGFNLDNQLMKIIPKSSEDKFEVFVGFEQNLRVYVGEKRVKDLDEWHLKEPFIKVLDSAQFYFRLPSYNYVEKHKEISKNLNKIKEAILKIEGEYINTSLDTVTELSRLPVEFWISKIFIKIQHFDTNGNKKTIFIINQSSWGC